MRRALTLKSEHLTDLTTGELTGLVGAAPAAPTTPAKECLQTTVNSNVLCSGGDCMTRGTSCAC